MVNPITVDFETEAIEGNPLINPPRPVGVAVWVPGQEPTYLAWGHSDENNCTWAEAHEYLAKLAQSKRPLLFHNAPFDLSVWNHYFCNAQINLYQNWQRIHDTLYLLFLSDPYASTFSLKPSADRYLGMQADEQSELYAWIVRNVPGATLKNAGAYISKAPADLVGRYAVGDVVRTRHLFDQRLADIQEKGMEAAYDRERRLMPTLVYGTQRGIRLDTHTLEHHETVYTRALEIAKGRIEKLIGVHPDSSNEVLADALEASGSVTEWVMTGTGKRSFAKGNIHIVRPDVKVLYEYTGALETCLSTFIRPWLDFSQRDGRLHPNWNQVRQARTDRDSKGTRTGRLSSDQPNFQNVPNEFRDRLGKALTIPDGLPPLPVMRRYCLPDEGHVWLKRDFSSQEIRILAHFEEGALGEAYRANPDLDPHTMAQELITQLIGITYARKDVKITGFSIIYGTGANGLSVQLDRPYNEAFAIKEAYLTAMPGIRALMDDVQRRGRGNQPIRTWGGRLYYSEPPKVIDGRMRDFHYKLLNYLIQGSAADQTKQAICDWESARRWDHTFVATVHDEINISAPEEEAARAMTTLREAMNADRFDVPFKSEGFKGANWADIEEYEP